MIEGFDFKGFSLKFLKKKKVLRGVCGRVEKTAIYRRTPKSTSRFMGLDITIHHATVCIRLTCIWHSESFLCIHLVSVITNFSLKCSPTASIIPIIYTHILRGDL
jgi:hypothetical protein